MDSGHVNIVDEITDFVDAYRQHHNGNITLNCKSLDWSHEAFYDVETCDTTSVTERPEGEEGTTEEYFRATIDMDHSFILNTDNYKTQASFKVPNKFRLSNDNPESVSFPHIGKTKFEISATCPIRAGDVKQIKFVKKAVFAKIRIKTYFGGGVLYEGDSFNLTELLDKAGLIKADRYGRQYFESTGTMQLEIKRHTIQ